MSSTGDSSNATATGASLDLPTSAQPASIAAAASDDFRLGKRSSNASDNGQLAGLIDVLDKELGDQTPVAQKQRVFDRLEQLVEVMTHDRERLAIFERKEMEASLAALGRAIEHLPNRDTIMSRALADKSALDLYMVAFVQKDGSAVTAPASQQQQPPQQQQPQQPQQQDAAAAPPMSAESVRERVARGLKRLDQAMNMAPPTFQWSDQAAAQRALLPGSDGARAPQQPGGNGGPIWPSAHGSTPSYQMHNPYNATAYNANGIGAAYDSLHGGRVAVNASALYGAPPAPAPAPVFRNAVDGLFADFGMRVTVPTYDLDQCAPYLDMSGN